MKRQPARCAGALARANVQSGCLKIESGVREGADACNTFHRRPREGGDPYSLNHRWGGNVGAAFSLSSPHSVVMGPGFRRDDRRGNRA